MPKINVFELRIEFRAILLSLSLLLSSSLFPNRALGQIIISEVCASNLESHRDTYGDTPDWIELKNISDSEVNLKGWSISDKPDAENSWQLPDSTLPPGGHILVNASGRARNSSEAVIMHTNTSTGAWEWYSQDESPMAYLDVGDEFEFKTTIRNYRGLGKWGNLGLRYSESMDEGAKSIGIYQMKYPYGAYRGHYNVYYRSQRDNLLHADINIYVHDEPDEYSMEISRKEGVLQVAVINNFDEVIFSRVYPNSANPEFNDLDWDGRYIALTLNTNDDAYQDRTVGVFEEMQLDGQVVGYSQFNFIDNSRRKESVIVADGEIHSDFSLNSGGETIYLFYGEEGSTLLFDSLSFPSLDTDLSFGRGVSSEYYSPGCLLLASSPNSQNNICSQGVVDQFSPNIGAGSYSDNITIFMTDGDQSAEYRYTTDGAEPTIESDLFPENYFISKSTTLRVRGFKNGSLPSNEYVATYLISENSRLPIYSIIADSTKLYSTQGGLLTDQSYWDYQLHGYFELLNIKRIWKVDIGLQGATSRDWDQKSLILERKQAYGSREFKYDFFEDGIEFHNDIVLKNHSSAWLAGLINNQVSHEALKNLVPLNTEFKPGIRYINGSYDGLVQLTDRVNRNYLAQYYDVDPESIVYASDSAQSVTGNKALYDEKMSMLEGFDGSTDSYESLNKELDIENFIDYFIGNLHFFNNDWPYQNYKYFFSNDIDSGRLKFIFSDMDRTMEIQFGGEIPDKMPHLGDGTFLPRLFINVLKNDKFRYNFINRYCDLLETELTSEKIIEIVDSLNQQYEPEIDRHKQLWKNSALDWHANITHMRWYNIEKSKWIYVQLKNYFNLSGSNVVEVNSSHPGNSLIEFSGLNLNQFPTEATYMNDIPIRIKAIASQGYRFVRWEQEWLGDNPETEIILSGDSTSISAIFESTNSGEQPSNPVITEIMYAAPKDNDPGDWVEIYNPSPASLDLSGWSITDSREKEPMTFTPGTTIEPYGSVIIAENESMLAAVYPKLNIANTVTPMPFGLSRKGDLLLLLNTEGAVVDSVEYSVGDGWPDADRNGHSIELNAWTLDNAIGANWSQSTDSMGSPNHQVWAGMESQTLPSRGALERAEMKAVAIESGNLAALVREIDLLIMNANAAGFVSNPAAANGEQLLQIANLNGTIIYTGDVNGLSYAHLEKGTYILTLTGLFSEKNASLKVLIN